MSHRIIAITLGVIALYVGLVFLFGFAGPVALSIHFTRLAVSFAVLILYIPALPRIFIEVPPPKRDYLIAGIILTWLSGVGFSTWNVAGQVYHADTSVFTSPIAGFFSLLLLSGGIFHAVAPSLTQGLTRREAFLIGVLFAFVLVVLAPLAGPKWPCSISWVKVLTYCTEKPLNPLGGF